MTADAALALTPETNLCGTASSAVAVGAAQWNGWGFDLDNSRYQPEPALRAADVPKLGVKWAYGFQGGAANGQPTIVDDRLFVTSTAGRVYSLDAKTGCTYWTYDASTGVHTTITIGELAAIKVIPQPKERRSRRSHRRHHSFGKLLAHVETIKPPSAAFFGDDSGTVYALDAQHGTLLWKTRVDSHPFARIVGAPTLYKGHLYVPMSSSEDAAAHPGASCCTFRGSIAALDIFTGQVLWKTYTVADQPGVTAASAGVAIGTSPTVDVKRGLLYVGSGNAYNGENLLTAHAILAFDIFDGKLVWTRSLGSKDAAVNDAGIVSAPILRTVARGKQILLATRQNGVVYALDPDRAGDIVWQTPIPESDAANPNALLIAGPAADHRNFYTGLEGLTAYSLNTGSKRWSMPIAKHGCAWGETNCRQISGQAVTVMPGIAFSGSLDGHLRAYSTNDGKIVWDFDTAREFVTVNGIKASGGSLDAAGPSIVNGILYVNSASELAGAQPGNALIAYSLK